MPEPSKPSCEACGAKVPELRRGRCWGCYLRWTEARPVGFGAACTICCEKRRDNLRSVELHERWVPMCHNCSAKTARIEPTPPTLQDIRELLERDRRDRERRYGKKDTRIFKRDRRNADRREAARRLAAASGAGAPRPETEIDDLLMGFGAMDPGDPDQTIIRETPRRSADAVTPEQSIIIEEIELEASDFIIELEAESASPQELAEEHAASATAS